MAWRQTKVSRMTIPATASTTVPSGPSAPTWKSIRSSIHVPWRAAVNVCEWWKRAMGPDRVSSTKRSFGTRSSRRTVQVRWIGPRPYRNSKILPGRGGAGSMRTRRIATGGGMSFARLAGWSKKSKTSSIGAATQARERMIGTGAQYRSSCGRARCQTTDVEPCASEAVICRSNVGALRSEAQAMRLAAPTAQPASERHRTKNR